MLLAGACPEIRDRHRWLSGASAIVEEEGERDAERQISGVVKIERADSARSRWRARAPARETIEKPRLVENTRIIRALGAELPAARNMVIAARNPGRRGRRGRRRNSSNEDELRRPSFSRKLRSITREAESLRRGGN